MTRQETDRLDEFLAATESGRKQFTVYGDDAETDLAARFATRNVTVEHRQLSSGPDPYLTIEEEGEFLGAISIEKLEELLEPTSDQLPVLGNVSEPYQTLLELLEETIFTSMSRRQLLATSREIEDRAFRVGEGTLRVGFQQFSTFESQTDIYRHLASETALDIHVYGRADWDPPAIEGITYHERDDDSNRFWFLAFDGGNDEMQACALVAKQQNGEYVGCWTYDPETVTELMDAIRTDE